MLPRSSAHRPRLLIIGCGDVGLRVARLLSPKWRLFALTSSMDRHATLRAAGVMPIPGNLDQPSSLQGIGLMAEAVLHLAPPPGAGVLDLRTRALVNALARAGVARRLVYGSTTGVYGDVRGERIDETRTPRPATARAHRRQDAEVTLRRFGVRCGVAVSILRIPGIYAFDRVGGDPRDRVRRGAPVLNADEDVYTNHIHADDLARACVAALHRGAPQRIYHVSDDTVLKMGEHFDAVADAFGLQRPPRISRSEAVNVLPPASLSFMSESRRLSNRRLKEELRLKLSYPHVEDAWKLP